LLDGSNERLYHPDEESDPNLWKGIPLQKNLKRIDVLYTTQAFSGYPKEAAV